MKKLFFFLLISCSLGANAQLNLIQDKNFESADFSRIYVESDTKPASANVWAKQIQASWNDANVIINTGNDATRLKTAQMELIGTNSIPNTHPFRAFIAQRVGIVADAALYKFSFWAKAIIGTPTVRIFVKLDAYTNQYFIFDTGKPTTPTGTYTAYCKNLELVGTDWQYFENVVDLSKKTTSRDAINNTQAIATTASERTNVAVCLQNNTANSTVQFDEVEFTKVSATTINLGSGSTNLSSYTNCPTCNITVSGAGTELVLDENKTIGTITVSPASKLTLNAGKTLTVTTLNLESDASGTATLMDSYSTPTVNATVKQYVSAGRNWYMSSPVSAALYSWLSRGTSVQGWDEASKAWIPVTSGTLVRGKGYVQVATSTPETTGTTGTVNVTGTTNSGDVAITVSRTESGSSRGFNLIGNPYPSYLKWTGENGFLADATNDSISTSFWYRTKNTNGDYVFSTYNGSSHTVVGGTSVNSVLNEYIPPMQAFWIRVNPNSAVTTHNVGLTFKNNMRFHGVADNNKFKAPKADERQLLRLQLANGSQTDEALIYFDAAAINNFDNYDSPKMMNNSSILPDLYTTVGNERLAINGLNELTDNMELPLGFSLKAAATGLTLKVSELNNFTIGTKVYLKDKEQNTQTELFPTTEYAFDITTPTSNNESRFSLLFKAPSTTTGTSTAKNDRVSVFINTQNQIIITAKPNSNYAIYNAVGQLLESGKLTSNSQTSNIKHTAGVYVVKVNNQSTRVIVK